MLTIENLHARVGDREILKGLTLHVPAGEVHAIMGPNGSGKSTLAQVLAGREDYEVTAGRVTYRDQDLLALAPEERARAGVFLAFQYPIEIPGVNNAYLLKAALNAQRQARGEPPVDAFEFMKLIKNKMELVNISKDFLARSVNQGFSGGEKKRNEILQMLLLEPRLAVLDETDSGLDVDALKIVAHGVNSLRSPDRSMVLVTHYERLLELIVPDRVHVLAGGRIVKSGSKELARELDERGYDWVQAGGSVCAARLRCSQGSKYPARSRAVPRAGARWRTSEPWAGPRAAASRGATRTWSRWLRKTSSSSHRRPATTPSPRHAACSKQGRSASRRTGSCCSTGNASPSSAPPHSHRSRSASRRPAGARSSRRSRTRAPHNSIRSPR
jgi:Fe-S cluster assembly ATP-binding protein